MHFSNISTHRKLGCNLETPVNEERCFWVLINLAEGCQVSIIDFGLAKKYRDPKTHVHIPYRCPCYRRI